MSYGPRFGGLSPPTRTKSRAGTFALLALFPEFRIPEAPTHSSTIGAHHSLLPVRKGAIQASKVGKLAHLERMPSCCFAIKLDAKARAGRRKQVAVLPLWLDRHDVGQHGAGAARLFLDSKVAARQVQLQARSAGDRSERVVDG